MSRGAPGPLRSLALGAALIIGVLAFRAGVGGPLVVEGSTLSPSVKPGSWVWVWKVHRDVQAGDRVWVRWPGSDLTGAYRVVAVGPATVEVPLGAAVNVDGRAVPVSSTEGGWIEQYEDRAAHIIPGGPGCPATTVPAGHVFVLSDARPVAGDSRVHGAIPLDAILGTIATSSGRLGRLHDGFGSRVKHSGAVLAIE